MADDVAITAGSGTSIATDDCTSGHVQLMKLTYGADGNRTHVPADADGLLVNLGANNDVTVSGTVTVASHEVTNAGTFPVQVDGSALTALQLLDDTVFADDAAYTLGTSKLTAVGGVAVAHGAAPDAADALDAGAFLMNRHRVQWVIGGHPNIVDASARITGSNTDTALLPGTISAGTKIVITRLHVAISNACTVNVGVKIGFGTSTLPADNTTGVADVLVDNDGFPPGGGVQIGSGSGAIGVGPDGAELRITNDAPTSGTIHVNYSFYTIES
jgi:hypothetical protein